MLRWSPWEAAVRPGRDSGYQGCATAGHSPSPSVPSPAGGLPGHWETSWMILLHNHSSAVPPPKTCPSSPGTRPRGDPGSQHAPSRFPLPHPINLLLGEKTRPFIFQGRRLISSAALCICTLQLKIETSALYLFIFFFPQDLPTPACSRDAPEPATDPRCQDPFRDDNVSTLAAQFNSRPREKQINTAPCSRRRFSSALLLGASPASPHLSPRCVPSPSARWVPARTQSAPRTAGETGESASPALYK